MTAFQVHSNPTHIYGCLQFPAVTVCDHGLDGFAFTSGFQQKSPIEHHKGSFNNSDSLNDHSDSLDNYHKKDNKIGSVM